MKIFRILLVLFPLLVFSGTSIAQSQCGLRETIVEILESRAGEKLIGVGLVNPKRAIEIFVNKKSDTWTILGSSLTVDGNTTSCILFYGKTWMLFEEPIGDPASF